MTRKFLTALTCLIPALTLNAQEAPPAIPRDLLDHSGCYAPVPDKSDRDTCVRTQIYLDEHNHGPGKIDGAIGEFGKKAASVFNQIRGIPVGNWHTIIDAAKRAVPNPYTTYKIKDWDLKFITPDLPGRPSEQARRKYMGYRSLLEFVSERFHTSEEFLMALNKGRKSLYGLKPGDVVDVPNVTPFEVETIPLHARYEKDPRLSSRCVVVDISARVAIFFDEANKPFASFPVTSGEDRFIQYGEWKITSMITTPEFRWDKAMLENGRRSDEFWQLPIGPNSPVGVFWTGTTRGGVGLHGTSSPHTIGRSESHGCIRFANWDAVRLPKIIRPGARFIIR